MGTVNLCARRGRAHAHGRAAPAVLGVFIAASLTACGTTALGESTPLTPAAPAAQASGATSKPKAATSSSKPRKAKAIRTTKRAPHAKARSDSARPRTAAASPTKKSSTKETVRFDTGVRVALGTLRVVKVKAETPGEVAGPAVAVRIAISNRGSKAIDLDSAVVSLESNKGELGIATTAGAPEPLQGDLRPGDRAHGVYVFMLDPAGDRPVKVSVNYAAGAPVAVFSGRTP